VIVPGLISLLLTVSVDTTASAAQARGDSVVVLPEVRVPGTRLHEAERRLPTGSVTVLETGTSGRALETLAEVLGDAAGVRVQQYGGLGAFSTVSLRGSPASQVAFFLDGQPLGGAAHSVVSLGDLPASAIERVEVYRGSSPLELGPAGAAGAINLVTASQRGHRGARIAGGSFGTWEATGDAGAGDDQLSGLIHAGYQRSRGDFTYRDDNGTPFNPDDDGLSTRENNHFASGSLLATGTWRPDERWRLVAHLDGFDKAQGVPGIGAVPAYQTHLDFLRTRARIEAGRLGEGAVPGLRLAAGLSREHTQFRDPGAELGLGAHDTDDHTGDGSLALDLDWPELPGSTAFTAGGALRREWARLSDTGDPFPDPPESRRVTAGGEAGLQWRPYQGRVIVHGAARADRLHDQLHWVGTAGAAGASDVTRTLFSPQLGVRWEVMSGLALRANAASAERPPDFIELFGNQGSVIGNPALRPERTRNADLGLSWTHGFERGLSLALDAAHFESRAEDLVVYIHYSQSSVRAENISRARIRGEELSLRLTSPQHVGVTGGLTHLDTRDEGPVPYWYGNELPLRPGFQAFVRADWTIGSFRAALDLEYIGPNYLDRANLQPVDERLPFGASVSFAPGFAGMRWTLEGKNLGNDRIADVAAFPLPGRSLFASCEIALGPSQ
jgi:iron complex outermembrane receptor protein